MEYNFNTQECERTKMYGPLCGPSSSSCGGLWPSAKAFVALWAKKGLFMLFLPILGYFRCSVVTSVTFSSNLNNFEKNPKKSQENFKKSVIKSKNVKKYITKPKSGKCKKKFKKSKNHKKYFFFVKK